MISEIVLAIIELCIVYFILFVASGRWRVGGGEWAVASGQWRVGGGEWAVASGQWHVGSGM